MAKFHLRPEWVTRGISILILIAAGCLVGFALNNQQSEIHSLRERNAALVKDQDQDDRRYDKLLGEYTSLFESSKNNGVDPTTTDPADIPSATSSSSSPGATGATGAVGPTGVKGDKGDKGDTGSSGLPGAPGSSASGTAGSDGLDGASGTNGLDGAPGATGPSGPAGPAGPPGETGAKGDKGDTGVGISSITCGDDADWHIVYTDGTSSETAGPCRVTVPDLIAP